MATTSRRLAVVEPQHPPDTLPAPNFGFGRDGPRIALEQRAVETLVRPLGVVVPEAGDDMAMSFSRDLHGAQHLLPLTPQYR